MRLFLLNLLLALAWGAINGSFMAVTLVAGFAIGYVVLVVARPALGPSGYYAGLWRVLGFAGFYVWELILSSVRVAHDVLTPRLHARPGIIALPLDAETDAEITVLVNLIALTPGTLPFAVSSDRKTLYIHAMYLDDGPDALRADLKHRFERRVLRLWRAPVAEDAASGAGAPPRAA